MADAVERLGREGRPEALVAAALAVVLSLTHARAGRIRARVRPDRTPIGAAEGVVPEAPAAITVAVTSSGDPVGDLELWGVEATPDTVARVRVVALQLGTMLQSNERARRAERGRLRARRLAELGRALRDGTDPERIMAIALEGARTLAEAPVALLTPAGGGEGVGAVCLGTAPVAAAALGDLVPAELRPAVAAGGAWSGRLDPAGVLGRRGFRRAVVAGAGPHSGIGHLAVLDTADTPAGGGLRGALAALAGQTGAALAAATLRQRVAELGTVDPLTHFFNAAYFHNRLAQECQRAGRSGGRVSVLILSPDGLADLRGGGGDGVLRALAARMTARLRAMDVGCRVGTDELAAILPDVAGLDALRVGERLRGEALGEQGPLRGVPLSIGVASFPEQAGGPEALHRNARRALEWARMSGGDRTFLFHRDAAGILEQERRRLDGAAEDVDATLIGLADGVDALHPLTAGHGERVGRLCHLLAAELGLPGERRARVALAGRLHDVGKAGMPREVVAAATPPTPAQEADLARHPERGAQMVLSSHLADLAPAIRHQLERPDGTGTPAGLRGEAIPIEARIIAVADHFDRLCSGGPGRAPLPARAALERLATLAGGALDAAVLRALIVLIEGGVGHSTRREVAD